MGLKVAVAGLGRVGSAFCEALFSRGVDVVAVADPDIDSPAVRRALAYGCKVYREGLELGMDPAIDMVFDLTQREDFLLKLRRVMDEMGNRRTVIVPRAVALFIWRLMTDRLGENVPVRYSNDYGFCWNSGSAGAQSTSRTGGFPHIMRAPHTAWSTDLPAPIIHPEAFVSPGATVIGDVIIGRNVLVAPGASIRGDEGRGIFIDEGSNVQDGVIIHGLENSNRPDLRCAGPDGMEYSVYIGKCVSLAHGAVVHGPVSIGDGSFVGFNGIVLKSVIGRGVFVSHGAIVIGVDIADDRFVPVGAVVDTRAKADALPEKTEENTRFAADVIKVNHALCRGYRGCGGLDGVGDLADFRDAGR